MSCLSTGGSEVQYEPTGGSIYRPLTGNAANSTTTSLSSSTNTRIL